VGSAGAPGDIVPTTCVSGKNPRMVSALALWLNVNIVTQTAVQSSASLLAGINFIFIVILGWYYLRSIPRTEIRELWKNSCKSLCLNGLQL
jgi:hypothetical protein